MLMSQKIASTLFFSLLFALAGVIPVKSVCAQTVQITSPADGDVVHPGQRIIVIVQGTPDIQTAMITVDRLMQPAKETSPLHYALTIPIELPEGVYHIRAVAQSGGQFVQSEPISLNVEWTEKLVSAEPYPADITFDTIGQNTQLKILGTFADGGQADIARSGKSVYVSTNPDVATASFDGVITSLGVGNATIVYRNSGVGAKVNVTVAGRNTSTKTGQILMSAPMIIASPLSKGSGDDFFIAHVTAENKGNIPLAFIKILSAKLNGQPVRILPPEKLNFKMGDKWSFDLAFSASADAQNNQGTLTMSGVYSAIPEFYHHEKPFDNTFPVDLR